jgi:hypothetical protein
MTEPVDEQVEAERLRQARALIEATLREFDICAHVVLAGREGRFENFMHVEATWSKLHWELHPAAPGALPARGDDDREIQIHWQTAPVHEFAPFDDRDELLAQTLEALKALLAYHDDIAKAPDQRLLDAGYAAIARATGEKS